MALASVGLWLNAAVAFADGPGASSLGQPLHVASAVSQAAKPVATTVQSVANSTTATAKQASSSAAATVHQATSNASAPSVAPQASQAPKPPGPVKQAPEAVHSDAARVVAIIEPAARAIDPVVTEATQPIVQTVDTLTTPAELVVEPIIQTVDALTTPADPVVEPIIQTVEMLATSVEPVVVPIVQTVERLSNPAEPLVEPIVQTVEPVVQVVAPMVEATQLPIADLQPIVEAGAAPEPPHDLVVPTRADATNDTPTAQTADQNEVATVTDVGAPTVVDEALLGLTPSPETWSVDSDLPRVGVDVTPALGDAVAGVHTSNSTPSATVDVRSPSKPSEQFGELMQPFDAALDGPPPNGFGGVPILALDSFAIPLAVPALGPPIKPNNSNSAPPPLAETPTGPPELPAAAQGGCLVSGAGGAGAAVLVAAALVLSAAWRILWQVARLRPGDITLPNLAPPG